MAHQATSKSNIANINVHAFTSLPLPVTLFLPVDTPQIILAKIAAFVAVEIDIVFNLVSYFLLYLSSFDYLWPIDFLPAKFIVLGHRLAYFLSKPKNESRFMCA